MQEKKYHAVTMVTWIFIFIEHKSTAKSRGMLKHKCVGDFLNFSTHFFSSFLQIVKSSSLESTTHAQINMQHFSPIYLAIIVVVTLSAISEAKRKYSNAFFSTLFDLTLHCHSYAFLMCKQFLDDIRTCCLMVMWTFYGQK